MTVKILTIGMTSPVGDSRSRETSVTSYSGASGTCLADVSLRFGQRSTGLQRGTRGTASSNHQLSFLDVFQTKVVHGWVVCSIDLCDLTAIHASLGPSLLLHRHASPPHALVRALSRGRQEEGLDEASRSPRCEETGRFL